MARFFKKYTSKEKQMPRWDQACKKFVRNACERK